MNKVILSGRLTADPVIRYSQQNLTIANFTLAVDRVNKTEEQTADFIRCTAFGKTADVLEKHCVKGTKILVEGSWQTGSYTNKDGQKINTNDCAVFRIEFLESKSAAQQSNQYNHGNSSIGADDGFMNIPDGIDEELPFT